MKIGVPTEIKSDEYRVGLVPSAVAEFVSHGHSVIVQAGAGMGIGADDEVYFQAGASIASHAAEVFAEADMIIKVKEPQEEEISLLREGQILFTYLHLAPDPDQLDGLKESGCVAFGYETFQSEDGDLPLLAPMSEVAGRLSIQAASEALVRHRGGPGMLMGGVPGVVPASVVVIGGGTVGLNASKMAVGLGANVTILDRSLPRLRYLDDLFQGRIKTRYSHTAAIEELLETADVVVGSVLIPGASAPKLVTRDMLARMRPGAVLVDVAIDQGGCFETSRPTSHAEPTYVLDDVIHYCVANMPGTVPKTAAHALNNASLEVGLTIADKGWRECLDDPFMRSGLNVACGEVVHPALQSAYQ